MLKKKKETTIEDLAGMVQRGFGETDKKLVKIDKRMDTLERGQEDIKLHLDNVAYRFELRELENRVKILERKMAGA